MHACMHACLGACMPLRGGCLRCHYWFHRECQERSMQARGGGSWCVGHQQPALTRTGDPPWEGGSDPERDVVCRAHSATQV